MGNNGKWGQGGFSSERRRAGMTAEEGVRWQARVWHTRGLYTDCESAFHSCGEIIYLSKAFGGFSPWLLLACGQTEMFTLFWFLGNRKTHRPMTRSHFLERSHLSIYTHPSVHMWMTQSPLKMESKLSAFKPFWRTHFQSKTVVCWKTELSRIKPTYTRIYKLCTCFIYHTGVVRLILLLVWENESNSGRWSLCIILSFPPNIFKPPSTSVLINKTG